MKKLRLGFVVVAVLAIAVIIAWHRNNLRLEDYFQNPKVGDIYILGKSDIYAPIKVASFDQETINFYQYLYPFAEGVPDREQLMDEEWDNYLTATYERKELKRMWDEGMIFEIYRD